MYHNHRWKIFELISTAQLLIMLALSCTEFPALFTSDNILNDVILGDSIHTKLYTCPFVEVICIFGTFKWNFVMLLNDRMTFHALRKTSEQTCWLAIIQAPPPRSNCCVKLQQIYLILNKPILNIDNTKFHFSDSAMDPVDYISLLFQTFTTMSSKSIKLFCTS